MIALSAVREQCAAFSEKSRVKVSNSAQIMIFELLNAIELDPDPRWSAEEDSGRVIDEFNKVLPQILQRLSEDQLLTELITTFDVIRWVGCHIDVLAPRACRRSGWDNGPWFI